MFGTLLDTTGFPPRWRCGTGWTAELGWTHIISDLLIFAAYLAIPFILLYFLSKRKDIPFHNIIILFGAFILFCGFNHLVEAYIFWEPIYKFSALVKVCTATVSVVTAIVLAYTIPKILNLPKYVEERSYMASIVESSEDAIIAFDVQGIMTLFNKSAQEILDVSENELKKSIKESLPEMLPNNIDFETILKNLHDNSFISPYEFKLEKGPYVSFFRGKISPIFAMDKSTLIGGSLIIRDITVEKKVKIHLQKANSELEKFAHIAAHDLKAPLRHISFFSNELAELAEGNKGETELINHIQRSINNMRNLIDGLHSFSKIQSNQLQRNAVDINDVIKTICTDSLALDIKNLNAEIYYSELPTISAHKSMIIQVFQNLIQNALKYSKSNLHPIIKIGCVEGDYEYEFCVEDNGIGIESDFYERIFDIFKKLSNDESDSCGIGLSICKGIVEKHGGKIWIKSTVGEGTSFFFTIPKESKKLIKVA